MYFYKYSHDANGQWDLLNGQNDLKILELHMTAMIFYLSVIGYRERKDKLLFF